MNKNTGSIYMFSGKGGVGKTTCAAATALFHSLQGERTLAISTDATPSLFHVFDVKERQKPYRVTDNLYIDEIGVKEVERLWDDKFGREVYEVFSSFVDINYDSFAHFMASMLPGLSDEFMVDYIRELKQKGEYDTIIWDTAPLGQTLALLHTPAMLVEHLRFAPRVYSGLKFSSVKKSSVMDIIKSWQKLSADSMQFLRDQVDFSIVTIPEALSYQQLDDIFAEMSGAGFKVKNLIINNVIKADGSPFLISKAKQQRVYLDSIYNNYSQYKIIEMEMLPYEIKGVEGLKEVSNRLFQ